MALEYFTATAPAYAKPLGKNITRKVKVGTRKVERTKGIFSKEIEVVEEDVLESRTDWEPNGKYSDTEIDEVALATAIEEIMNNMGAKGWRLHTVSLVTRGHYNFQEVRSMQTGLIGGWAWGYGMTGGAILTFERSKSAEA